MKNKFGKLITTLTFIMIFAVLAFAQKAEPKEIKFAKGKTAATVQGRLKADQQDEYMIHGKAAQLLTLTFSSTIGKGAEVFVFSPSTSGEGKTGNKTWSVEFGSEGQININVSCSKACSYKLTTSAK